jgi:hypothetical protein
LRWRDPNLRETPDALREIDVPDPRAANITTVVWATGYRYDSAGSIALFSMSAARRCSSAA